MAALPIGERSQLLSGEPSAPDRGEVVNIMTADVVIRSMKPLLCLTALLSVSLASAGSLRGALIVAADGTFLGTCDGKYSTDSIANKYGDHGSAYSSTSMYNKYSSYGSAYASTSAFNKYASEPPYILAYSTDLSTLFTSRTYRPTPQIANLLRQSGTTRVSASTSYRNAIDPNVLRATCENP